MAVPPAWDRRCLRYRRRELWPLISSLFLPTGRSCRLVFGNRLQRMLFQGEDMLGDNPISPLAGGRLTVELRVCQADERTYEPRPFGKPLGEQAFHRRCRVPRL